MSMQLQQKPRDKQSLGDHLWHVQSLPPCDLCLRVKWSHLVSQLAKLSYSHFPPPPLTPTPLPPPLQWVPLATSLPVRQPQGLGKGGGLCMWHLYHCQVMCVGELWGWYLCLFCLECKCVLVFYFKVVKPVVSSQPRTALGRQLVWLQPFYFLLPILTPE